jgi:hypothetical protein
MIRNGWDNNTTTFPDENYGSYQDQEVEEMGATGFDWLDDKINQAEQLREEYIDPITSGINEALASAQKIAIDSLTAGMVKGGMNPILARQKATKIVNDAGTNLQATYDQEMVKIQEEAKMAVINEIVGKADRAETLPISLNPMNFKFDPKNISGSFALTTADGKINYQGIALMAGIVGASFGLLKLGKWAISSPAPVKKLKALEA